MTARHPRPGPAAHDPEQDARLRAERVRAMLARWQREDVSDEPDWLAETISPLGVRSGERVRRPRR